jgi:hypothetical protein
MSNTADTQGTPTVRHGLTGHRSRAIVAHPLAAEN